MLPNFIFNFYIFGIRIIAVNYPAREQGVTRHMRGDQAKQKCHDIVLARVPEVRGKADLTKYDNTSCNLFTRNNIIIILDIEMLAKK